MATEWSGKSAILQTLGLLFLLNYLSLFSIYTQDENKNNNLSLTKMGQEKNITTATNKDKNYNIGNNIGK